MADEETWEFVVMEKTVSRLAKEAEKGRGRSGISDPGAVSRCVMESSSLPRDVLVGLERVISVSHNVERCEGTRKMRRWQSRERERDVRRPSKKRRGCGMCSEVLRAC